ncbi:hypothetical protein ABZY09_22075 [Streptomyces sp. NPDC002928]|uniref:hypothetical protein n=1 Tax=Streptomyces sp. NPDC002928 TaxID=3154440 RepID=UPI0033BE8CED
MTGHWVRIAEAGVHLGAGLQVTQVYVLTALHCLRDVSSEGAVLELTLSDGQALTGRVCDEDSEVDLAVIVIERASRYRLPLPPPMDWPRPSVRWQGMYEPPGRVAKLSGIVSHAPIEYRSAAGGVFTGLQLTAEQDLRDFSGYSGSPVDTDPVEETEERPVVGILMEQVYEHEDPNRGSNVLIAASVRYAMGLFPSYFGDGRPCDGAPARRTPCPGDGDPAEPTARKAAREAEVVLTALKEWEQSELISSARAEEERGHTLRQFRERALGDDADD